MNQRIASTLPIALISIVAVASLFNLFASQVLSGCAIISCLVFMFVWRQLVLTYMIPSDYNTRFDSAPQRVLMRAAKWSAIIAISVYLTVLLACFLAYILGGSWSIGGLLIMIVIMIARAPWIALASNWELHRVEPTPRGV